MNFVVGNTYSFNTLAPAVLGASFNNAKVIGVVGYEVAITMMNVDLKQRTIYPLLPSGTPSDPSKYTYLMLQTESNIKVVIAVEWIDINTVALVDSVTLEIIIPNVVSTDANEIRSMLTLLGYSGYTITTK